MARNDAPGDGRRRVSPRPHETAAPTIGTVTDGDLVGLPARDLDRQPSVRVEAGALGRLWVQACSLAGRSHTGGADPTSGQDSYSYRLSDDGRLAVFAVADGLGSRPRSHVGAHVAAVEACARFAAPAMARLLDGPVGRIDPDRDTLAALADVQRSVVAAGAAGAGGRDVATTLLVAVLGVSGDRPRAVFVRVGDPAALLMQGGRFTERSLVFGRPASGPANSLSACIPMKTPEREVEVVRVGDLPADVAVVLVTDGVGNDLIASAQLRAWFEQRWAGPIDAPGMLDTLRYRRQGSVDDRTAVVVFADPHATPAPSPAPAMAPERAPAPTVPLVAPPPVAAPATPPAAVAPATASSPAPPRRAGSSRRAKVVGLVVAGVVVVAAALAVTQLSGSDDDAGDASTARLSTWVGPGLDPTVVVPTDDGAVLYEELGDVVDDTHVVTSLDGRLVALDPCPGLLPVADPPVALPPRACEQPVTPSLAVPDGDGHVLVVRGDMLTAVDGDRTMLVVGSTGDPLVRDASDVAIVGNAVVFTGPAGVGVARDPQASAPSVDDASATVAAALTACASPTYVSVEGGDGDRAVVAATCGGGGWALASVDPATADTCVLYTGDGAPPLPITTGRGDLVAVLDARGPSGELLVAPFDATCPGT